MTSATQVAHQAQRVSRRVSPQQAAAILGTTLVAGALLVLALWWHDTPRIAGPGGWLTSVGRVAGLLVGYGVLVQLLLMSRAPWLDTTIGTDRLTRWHAVLGRVLVCLLVTHGLFVVLGYAATQHHSVGGQAWTLLRSYPDILMAVVAGLLLIGVGVMSLRAVRRRVRYETWRYLHLYVYLAIALAFSHQFADGAEFVTHPGARLGWAAGYIGVASLLAWYRGIVPTYTMWHQRGEVVAVQREARGVSSITIRVRDAARLRARPGQFCRWRFLTPTGWWQSHPFSLSALPRDGLVRITVKDVGDHSRQLQRVRPGTRVVFTGPYGAVTAELGEGRRVLLLAGGIGITPLRAIFEQLASPNVTMLVRTRRPDEAVFAAELRSIADARGATVRYLSGPRRSDADPFVSDRLRRLVPDLAEREVFVCGPPGFTAEAERTLSRLGVPRRQVHAERFALTPEPS